MIDPKIETAFEAALKAFSKYNSFDATKLTNEFGAVFASDKEFLLVDEDEFQDEYRIYEPVIANQILIESPLAEISKVAQSLPEDSELKELFYPMMCFFQNVDPSDEAKAAIAAHALNKEFDM